MSVNFCKIRHKYPDGSYGKPYYVYSGKHPDYVGVEVWYNFNGGWCFKDGTEIVESGIFIGSKEDFIDLNRKEIFSHLIKKSSKYGWLSPHCEWFPCDYTHHEELAIEYFGKKDESELEEEGWIKVYKDPSTGKPCYWSINANTNQKEWLNDHNIPFSKYGW